MAVTIVQKSGAVLNQLEILGGQLQQFVEPGDGDDPDPVLPVDFLPGRLLAAALFLAVERDQDGHLRGGMALAVFDEAFSKLDLQNTVSALGFLDELGLQVLLAAPDEKYGQIAEHVDTIVNVYRDGGSVHTVSYTHLRAHETVLDLVCRLLLEKKKQHINHTLLSSSQTQTETYFNILDNRHLRKPLTQPA